MGRRSARQASKTLTTSHRTEVLRLAKAGQTHPDPDGARVAHEWATEFVEAGWWNRIPGWLLPLLAGCLALALWFVHPILATIAGLGAIGTAWVVSRARGTSDPRSQHGGPT